MLGYRNAAGFSLLEVLISFFILSFSLTASYQVLLRSQQHITLNIQKIMAYNIASDLWKRISNNPLESYTGIYQELPKAFKSCIHQHCLHSEIKSWDLFIAMQPLFTPEPAQSQTKFTKPIVCIQSNSHQINITIAWIASSIFVESSKSKCALPPTHHTMVALNFTKKF